MDLLPSSGEEYIFSLVRSQSLEQFQKKLFSTWGKCALQGKLTSCCRASLAKLIVCQLVKKLAFRNQKVIIINTKVWTFQSAPFLYKTSWSSCVTSGRQWILFLYIWSIVSDCVQISFFRDDESNQVCSEPTTQPGDSTFYWDPLWRTGTRKSLTIFTKTRRHFPQLWAC